MTFAEQFQQSAYNLRRDALTLWIAIRDPRTPRLARAVGTIILAYALSPLDLIPDVIPLIGMLDDLVIIPAGLLLLRRLIPDEVCHESRYEASLRLDEPEPQSRLGAVLVVTTWLTVAGVVGAMLWRALAG